MRLFLAFSAATTVLAALVLALPAGVAQAGSSACGSASHGSPGYAYAGHQSARTGHGVRATITATAEPSVAAGHVAGWVGVGGRGEGPNGEDSWLQVGVASLPNTHPLLYAEVTRPGSDPVFTALETDLPVGASRRVAVLEIAERPGWWRVWVNGKAVTEPIRLPGSSGSWRPIATAESWNGGQSVCNRFAFRFDAVAVAGASGGAWQPFTPGYRFQDRGYSLRTLTPDGPAKARRALARVAPTPYAFEAASL